MGDQLNDVEFAVAGIPARTALVYCLRCGMLLMDRIQIREDHATWHELVEQPANTALLIEVETLRRTNDDLRRENMHYRAGADPLGVPMPAVRSPGALWSELLGADREDRLTLLGNLIAVFDDYGRLVERNRGLSQGETRRLRLVEQALTELGAPGHSTADDPGGPMIAWIRNTVASRDELEQELANRGDLPSAVVRLLATISALGAPGGTHVDSATKWVQELVAERDKLAAELASLQQKTGPYVWRPGDPPPPTYVQVLHDTTETNFGTGHNPVYLCRAVNNPDLWIWLHQPDRAVHCNKPELTWERAAQDAAGPLTEVPRGDL